MQFDLEHTHERSEHAPNSAVILQPVRGAADFDCLLVRARAQALSDNIKPDFLGRVLVDLPALDGQPATTVSYCLDVPAVSKFSEGIGSIIHLQQEFHFHLALIAKLYKRLDPLRQYPAVVDAARLAVLDFIRDETQRIYHNASTRKNASIASINHALDKAGKSLAGRIPRLFRDQIYGRLGLELEKADFDQLYQKKSTGKRVDLAVSTSPSSADFLYIDEQNGMASLITGSRHVAHGRRAGAREVADRQIISHRYDAVTGKCVENIATHIRVRVPSLPPKKASEFPDGHKPTEHDYVADVAEKLNYLNQRYSFGSAQGQGNPPAFVYNLYTALYQVADGSNKQTQSARHIVKGVHQYNAQQRTQAGHPTFCFLQGISINGWGNALSYSPVSNELQREMTLMAEMALMYTVAGEEAFTPVMTQYNAYLQKEGSRESYFLPSAEGKKAKEAIEAFKNKTLLLSLDQQPEAQADSPLMKRLDFLAKTALSKLMAGDLHHEHNYATLVQTLSVFIEPASISGCKSGNERTVMVNGRVLVLESCLNNPSQSSLIFQELEALASATDKKTITTAANQLNRKLDMLYDQRALQGPATAISLSDQAGPSKVINRGLPSTNKAESRALKNLFQAERASAMQSHKNNLSQSLATAWKKPPSTWRDWYKDLGAGIFLTVVTAAVTTLGAVVLNVYGIDLAAIGVDFTSPTYYLVFAGIAVFTGLCRLFAGAYDNKQINDAFKANDHQLRANLGATLSVSKVNSYAQMMTPDNDAYLAPGSGVPESVLSTVTVGALAEHKSEAPSSQKIGQESDVPSSETEFSEDKNTTRFSA